MPAGLESPRFASNATLLSCVNDRYRVTFGEPDTTAVRLLQTGLHDLGYDVGGGLDGQFGQGTAVGRSSRLKTDEQLDPADPVASRGTVGRLDEYFRHEPADPDAPDGSRDGLDEIAQQAADDPPSLGSPQRSTS